MPTVAQLDQLKALVERLAPLASIGPGELIKAQAWNDVVGSVIAIARAVLAQDATTVVAPHDHVDQVKLAWLDPTVRGIVERGPIADPATEGRLGEIERNIARASTQIDKLDQNTKEVRDRVAAVSTRDLARQSDVANLRSTVGGLSDSKDDVLALRTTLQSVQKDVQTALTVGQKLTVNGQPVDMAVIDQRIKNVEQLQTRLRTPAGDLLDATQLENRLTQLTNTLVSQKQLEDFFNSHPPKLPQATLDNIQASLHSTLKIDLDAAAKSLDDKLSANVTQRFAQIDQTVSRAVADALPGATQTILGTIRPEIATAATKTLADAQAALTSKLAEATGALRTEVTGQLDTLRQSTKDLVQAQVSSQVTAQLDPVRKNVTDLQQGLTAVTKKQTEHDTTLVTLGTRVETVARDDAGARADLKTSVLAEIDRRITLHAAAVDTKLADLTAQQQQRIDASIASVRSSLNDQISKSVTDAVSTEVKKAETRINANMAGVASDQLAAVQDKMQTTVNAAVANAMQSLPGQVSQEVRRQTANMPDLVKAQFATLQPSITQMVNTLVEAKVVEAKVKVPPK